MKGAASVSVLLCCVPAPAIGQSQVVPASYAASEAPGAEFWALSPFAARRQLLLDTMPIPSLGSHPVVGLAVRRNMGDPDAYTGGQLYVEIRLSHSPRAATAASPVFASNRGQDKRLVFAATVNVPDAPPASTTPAPWLAPYSVTFPFTAPFRYVAGPLCIETLTLTAPPGGKPYPKLPWWPVDAAIEDPVGAALPFGSSCITGMPGQPAGAEPRTLAAGATAVLFLRGTRRSGTGLCAIGTSSARLGSIALPLDLGPLGAPGCQLLNDVAALLPFSVTGFPNAALGEALIELQAPAQPSIAGSTLYSQWIMLEPGVNSLAATTSNAVKATFGARSPGSGWVESVDTGAAAGRVLTGRVPVLLFVRS